MEKKKIIRNTIFITLGVLLLGVAGYFGYRYYLQLKREVLPVYHAVPGNADALFEVDNPSDFWEQFNQNQFAKELTHFPELRQWFHAVNQVDSLAGADETLKRWVNKEKIVFSLHYRGSDKFSVLGLLQLPNTRQRKQILSFLENHVAVSELSDKPYRVYKASVNDSTEFFFSVPEGIWMASFDHGLIKQSIQFLQKGRHILSRQDFKNVYQSRGKDVDANLYFNHDGFHRFLGLFAHKSQVNSLSHWSDYAGWTEVDIMLEDEGIWFSGYTTLDDSSKQFLNIFRNNPADKIKMPGILPANTAVLSYFGFDGFQKFYKQYKSHLGQPKKRKDYIKNFREKYGVDLPTYLLTWIGDEIGKNIVKTTSGNYYGYAVIHSRDKKETIQSLNKLSVSISEKIDKPLDTATFRGYSIGKIQDPYMFRMIFGQQYDFLKNPYYTVIDDYAVFANSDSALKYMVNNFLLNKTLKNDEQYINFSRKIAGQANVYMYFNLRNALDYLKPVLSKDLREFSDAQRAELHDIPMGGFQYKYQNGRIYTNFYLKADTGSIHQDQAQWQLALDAPLAMAPQFVIDHHTGNKKIIAFDRRKQMYLIDRKGEIQWKIKIKELPVGPVEVIDYYNNDKYQYLFNTPNLLYCIAINGETVGEYPHEIQMRSVNPLTAFDYKGNKDYRILLAAIDKGICNYQKDGEKTRGWQKPTTEYLVKNQIQRIVLDDKDFIIAADTAGQVKFLDRRGESRITPEPAFTNQPSTKFYKFTMDKKPCMMTTDQSGRIILIDKNGKVQKYTLNEFSPNYAFAFKDFDNDGKREFIFLDEGYLYVYNHQYKIVLKQQIDDPVLPEIDVCNGTKKSWIFLRTEKAKRVIRLNEKGIKPLPEAHMSDYPVMIYKGLTNDFQNVIFSRKNIIESVPLK